MSASIKAGLNNDMHLMTDGVTRAYIDSDGNVGIGTSSPSTTDSGYNGGTLHMHNTGTGSSIRLTNATTGTGASDGMLISKWNNSNTYFTNFDNDAETIFTQSNSGGSHQTTMILDGNGYVTKPNQPCFVAGSGSSYSISTGGSLIDHDHIFINQGSHYNNTNKRFTAPATGKYYFWHRLVVGNGASGVIEAKIAVNGSEAIRDYSYVHGTSQYDNSIACGVIVLNSGDYVEPQAYWNGSSSTTVIGTSSLQITSWGGYLLG